MRFRVHVTDKDQLTGMYVFKSTDPIDPEAEDWYIGGERYCIALHRLDKRGWWIESAFIVDKQRLPTHGPFPDLRIAAVAATLMESK